MYPAVPCSALQCPAANVALSVLCCTLLCTPAAHALRSTRYPLDHTILLLPMLSHAAHALHPHDHAALSARAFPSGPRFPLLTMLTMLSFVVHAAARSCCRARDLWPLRLRLLQRQPMSVPLRGSSFQWGCWGQLKKLILEGFSNGRSHAGSPPVSDTLDSGGTDASVWTLCGHWLGHSVVMGKKGVCPPADATCFPTRRSRLPWTQTSRLVPRTLHRRRSLSQGKPTTRAQCLQ